LGDYARAAALGEEALDLHPTLGHRGRARALLALGDVARDLGEPTEVRARCAESLCIFRELGDPLGEAFSLHNLAVAAYHDGNLGLARAQCEDSLVILRRLSVGRALAEVLASLGPILDAAGEPAPALVALTEALSLAWRVGPRWVVAATLEGLAGVAAGQRLDLLAVELASGGAALRTEIGIPVRPNWHAGLEQVLAATGARLGPDAFARAWAQGQARPLSDMVAAAAALEIVAPSRAARVEGVREADRPFDLTPRELDVLRLLVTGKTDREIAETLFIGIRTVQTHVTHLFAKLGVNTRAEAAAFAVRRDLV
jgi:DNA-binding CsgD family transcriptional regulator